MAANYSAMILSKNKPSFCHKHDRFFLKDTNRGMSHYSVQNGVNLEGWDGFVSSRHVFAGKFNASMVSRAISNSSLVGTMRIFTLLSDLLISPLEWFKETFF